MKQDEGSNRKIKVKEGDSLVLQASVKESKSGIQVKESSPHALLSFEWLKDTRPLTFGSRIKLMDKNSFRINSVLRSDRGMYQVIVK